MSTNFYNLLDLTKSYEPSNGEKCNEFGNNVLQPVAGGISDFNKGIATMSPYGSYSVALNEAVEYEYDAQLLFDHLKPLEEYFANKLKEKNQEEMRLYKSTKDKNFGSAIGFMQGLDGDVNDEEANVIKSLKHVEHESQFPPILSHDIEFESKHNFLNTLKTIYSNLPDEMINNIVANASGFISEFNINSYRKFINTIKEEVKNRNYTHKARETRQFK